MEESYLHLGPRQRVLKLLGHKWVVSTRLPGKGSSSLREQCYSFIIDAMERWELSRLKKCLWCTKFFAADPRQKYCNTECGVLADRRGAKEKRVPAFRRRQKDKTQKKVQRDPDRRAIMEFSKFMDLATKKRCTKKDQLIIMKWIKTYGRKNIERGRKVVKAMMEERKAGDSDKQIWKRHLYD